LPSFGQIAPKDQRTASAYIFGAICPKEGNYPPPIPQWLTPFALRLAGAGRSVRLGRL